MTDQTTHAYLARFRHHLELHLKEPGTVKVYSAEIAQFFKWLDETKLQIPEVQSHHLLTYREWMLTKGRKISTVNRITSILSSFFKWAGACGIVEHNPAERIRMPEIKPPPRGLTDDEAIRLLRLVRDEKNRFKRARNLSLIYAMLHAGLRVEEVSQLRLDSLQEGVLVVYDGDLEGRRVPVDREAAETLREWALLRAESAKLAHRSSPYLFVTERSGYMQPRAIQFVVESYSDKLGFPNVCKTLRHTFCYRLVRHGVPLDEIRRYAGHKSIYSTLKYMDSHRR